MPRGDVLCKLGFEASRSKRLALPPGSKGPSPEFAGQGWSQRRVTAYYPSRLIAPDATRLRRNRAARGMLPGFSFWRSRAGATPSGPCSSNGANRFPIASADLPGALLPAVSFLAAFGRRPWCPLTGPRWPASETRHTCGLMHCSKQPLLWSSNELQPSTWSVPMHPRRG
jgi:hypothetical protein